MIYCQFPRFKHYLSNLNHLLQDKPIMTAEVLLNRKLFPRQTEQYSSRCFYRGKNSLQLSEMSPKKTNNQIINSGSHPIKQIHYKQNNMPFLTIYPQARSAKLLSYESRNSTRLSLKNVSTCRLKQCKTSKELKSQKSHEYLRKGSNIEKKVTINLLRNKIRNNHEVDLNQQTNINKIIQLYRGKNEIQDQLKITAHKHKRAISSPHKKSIDAWQNDFLHDVL